MSNLYMRRFILTWKKFGYEQRLRANIVNYADDLVICCRPGKGPAAMAAMRALMTRLGLTVNEQKTRLVSWPEETFDFLGYTFGRFYGKEGVPYLGTRPSKKAVRKLLGKIHEETSSAWYWQSPIGKVATLNPILRGWCNYFDQGPVVRVYRIVRRYTERRLRRWLGRRSQGRGTGYKQFPDRYLYEQLGLYRPAESHAAMLNAKA